MFDEIHRRKSDKSGGAETFAAVLLLGAVVGANLFFWGSIFGLL